MDGPVEDWKDDKLFEPTVDMMVNDFDDEQTMEEEEKLADPQVFIFPTLFRLFCATYSVFLNQNNENL